MLDEKKSKGGAFVSTTSYKQMLLSALKDYSTKNIPLSIIPVEYGGKKPLYKWKEKEYTYEELLELSQMQDINLGIKLGNPIVDVDLDTEEAVFAAKKLLPPTGWIFGRPSHPSSHYLYICKDAEYCIFTFKETIAEIRAAEHQTVIPPSAYDNGEYRQWEIFTEPGEVTFQELKKAVAKVAAAVLFARYYPVEGQRQNAILAATGWLARNNWTLQEIKTFIETVATLANDEEVEVRLAQIPYTVHKTQNGEETTGFPTLKTIYSALGDEYLQAFEKIATWLALDKTEREFHTILPISNNWIEFLREDELDTDTGNAKRLINYFGDKILFVPQRGWYYFDNKRWQIDVGEVQIKKFAEQIINKILEEAMHAPDRRTKNQLIAWAKKTQNGSRIKIMIEKAVAYARIANIQDFDSNPYLVNTQNGIVDIRTKQLIPHSSDFLITKICNANYNPTLKPQKFEQFLQEIFLGNQEWITTLKRALGYSITGDVSEQKFFICHGYGANGKSTLLSLIQRILGDYAKTVAKSIVMDAEDRHPTSIADLQGVRFALLQETEEQKYLSAATVKNLTGGDKIKARYMRQDYFEFEPTHKLWLATNHKPIITDTTYALWRRIVFFPFQFTVPKDKLDSHLSEKLFEERDAILSWLIDGAYDWYHNGLQIPTSLESFVEEYKNEMDVVQQFLKERCDTTDKRAETTFKELYEAFLAWANESGERIVNKKKFSQLLEEKGFRTKVAAGNKKVKVGIKLLNEQPTDFPPIENVVIQD